MNATTYFLGIDGGGTKTEFVCIDGNKEVLARHREGTTYHLQVGLDGAEQVIRSGLQAICKAVGITPQDFTRVFAGLPAFGEDSQVDPQLEKLCGEILGHDRYQCGNDMICGWAGSLECQDGINLVAGTGSIGYGERQGKTARVGGWGEIFSDEGSAYWIAVQGLNAFSRMSDGRIAKGPLHAIFTEAFSLRADLDICAQIMGPPGLSRDEIASLAPLVAAADEAGDIWARAIHLQAAEELAAMAHSLRTQLGFAAGEKAAISWSGGVVTNVAPVKQILRERLAETNWYRLIEPKHSPAYGAAIYAQHLENLLIAGG